MKNLVVVLPLAIMLASCGVESIPELRRETERAADRLEKDLGTRPQVGFAGWNGRVLGSVTVGFKSSALSDMQVSELEEHVRQALAESLTTSPQTVIVSVVSGQLELH